LVHRTDWVAETATVVVSALSLDGGKARIRTPDKGPARAAFMGLQSGFMGLGGVVFLTLGGALAQQNWHYPFGIYLFAWPIALLVFAFIVEPDRSNSAQPNLGSEPDLFLVVFIIFNSLGSTTVSANELIQPIDLRQPSDIKSSDRVFPAFKSIVDRYLLKLVSIALV
jgi:MFS family permease